MKLQGKLAIVTGGSSGMGLHIAKALADAGSRVIITGRNERRLAAAAESHRAIEARVCDITDPAAIDRLYEEVVGMGGCDVLVNNAGVFHVFDITQAYPLQKQLDEIDIDVVGPVRMIHRFLPDLLDRDSILVNVSSLLAFVPLSQAPVYSAAKAFIHSWTQSLRAQLADTRVRVVELMPPVVDTPMVKDLSPAFPRMDPKDLTAAFMKGLEQGAEEITPGQSGQVKFMQRVAPKFIFGRINKEPRG